MKVVGRYKIKDQKLDNRVYIVKCCDADCRAILEFNRSDVIMVEEEIMGQSKTNKEPLYSRLHYAVECPDCGNKIWLGEKYDDILKYLKNKKERKKALDNCNDVCEYD